MDKLITLKVAEANWEEIHIYLYDYLTRFMDRAGAEEVFRESMPSVLRGEFDKISADQTSIIRAAFLKDNPVLYVLKVKIRKNMLSCIIYEVPYIHEVRIAESFVLGRNGVSYVINNGDLVKPASRAIYNP
jgi:hypothetical protein